MSYTSENIKPVGKSVIVELLDPEDIVSRGGIVVKASIDMQEAKGKVVAVGTAGDLCVSLGDIVLLSKLNPVETTYNGKRCRMVRDGEILAVLKRRD